MTMVCFLLFSDDPSLDESPFKEAMPAQLPGGVHLTGIEHKSDNIIQIDFEDVSGNDAGAVILSRMPPMPVDDELRGSPLWPTLPEDFAEHQSHWIVTTAASRLQPLDQALLVTNVTNAVLSTHPTSLGVMWGGHAVKSSSESFCEIVDSLGDDELPLVLWIEFTIIPGDPEDDTPMVALTGGMNAFDLMEIESIGAPESPEEMLRRLSGICEYLLHNGPILEHGNTIGQTDNERITILHGDSAFGREGKVIHLKYGDDGPAVPMTSGGDSGGGLKSLLVLAGIVLLTGALIFGIVKSIGFVVAFFKSEPPEAPRMAKVTESTASDSVQPEVLADKAATEKIAPPPQKSAKTSSSQTKIDFATRESRKASKSAKKPWNKKPTDPNFRQWRSQSGDIAIEGTIQGVERQDGKTMIRLMNTKGLPESIAYDSVSEDDKAFAKKWYQRESNRPKTEDGDKLPMVDDAVRIKWGNSWWDGKVIEIDNVENRYKVSYDGWGSTSDEWKKLNELRWRNDMPILSAQ